MRELLRINLDTNPARAHTQIKEIDGARVLSSLISLIVYTGINKQLKTSKLTQGVDLVSRP